MNTDDFNQGLRDFQAICHAKATRQLRRVSLKGLEMIVQGTPVLTGCCRGNWVVSKAELSRQYDAAKVDVAGGATVQAGLARIESAVLGEDVLIENSTPYVMSLENGWSKQQPAGCMIRTPLAKLKQAIEAGAM